MADQLLLEQCAKGNRLAQRQMYERYAGRLFAICLRYLGREDAEEAHSNAWVKVFENLAHFRGDSKLTTWMTRIAVNECLMMLRKKNIFFQEMEEEMFEQAAGYVDDSDVEQLLQLVAELPVGYRTVFNLYAIEGYGHKEIASMLNISEGTSKSQLSRAREILKKGVEERVFNT
jgi:RNA polymerase sigma factor (sigma-70 family)